MEENEAQEPSTPQEPSQVEVEQQPSSLDDVYKKFNVEETAKQFQPQPPAPPTPQYQERPEQQPTAAPDPVLDPDAYRRWASGQATDVSTLKQSIKQLQNTFGAIAAREMKAREEADIRDAVQTVKKAGFEHDDDFIEIALGQKARQDPRFMNLYQGRHQNPQAWRAAVGAYANELKGKYAFRADLQLAENVRAARNSTSATPNKTEAKTSAEEYLEEAKDPAEWQRRWDQMVNRSRY